MARKKVKTATLTSVQALEKTFRDLPAKLILQCQKELATLKTQEQKITKALQKNLTLKKNTQKKLATLTAKSKGKLTAVIKKQLLSFKKILTQLEKETSTFMTQLKQMKEQAATLVQKQKQFSSMTKLLATLEKEVAKKKITIKKAKKSPKKMAKAAKKETMQPEKTPMTTHSEFSLDSIINKPETAEMDS